MNNLSQIDTQISVPEFLPGEYVEGWLERFRCLNNIASIKKAGCQIRLLANTIVPESAHSHEENFFLAVATVSGIALSEFLLAHTLFYFRECLNAAAILERSSAIRIPCYPSVRGGADVYFESYYLKKCSACARNDLLERGYTYTRRDHQIPGVHWCLQHECALEWLVPHDRFVSDTNCDRLVLRPAVTQATYLQNVSAPLRRYIEIALHAAAGKIYASSEQTHVKLSLRIHASSVLAQGLSNWSLTDDLKKFFPADWIENMEKLCEQSGRYVQDLLPGCGTEESRHSVRHYLVTLALLFNSASEAIDWLDTPLNPSWISESLQVQHGVNSWWNSQRKTAYVASGGKNIGVATRLREQATSAQMNSVGLPSLTLIGVATINALNKFGQGGVSLSDACALHGAKISQAEKLLLRASSEFLSAVSEIAKSKLVGHSNYGC